MNTKAEMNEVVLGNSRVTNPVDIELVSPPLIDPNGWDSYDPELLHASTAASAQPTVANLTPVRDAVVHYPFLAPPQSTDEIGRLGPYRVLKALGEGGMGIVLEAEDPDLKRLVALKTMKPEAAASSTARDRFLREARATAAVQHDNVVTIYQVGEDHGVPFLAMELLQGETLENRLKREKRLPTNEVLRIGRETALGLAAAHEHGLIHRDIKPENIWLEGARGRVKIVDFGLVLPVHEEGLLSRAGLVVGTPAYMSPEHAMGKAHDPRCDLFSLGSVLYRACTGLLPFKGATPFDMLLAITEQAPKPLSLANPDVSTAISELVMTLLAKNPVDRFPSARELAAAIELIESRQRKTVVPVIPPSAPSRKKRMFAVVAAAALLLAAATMAAQWNADPYVVGASTGEPVETAAHVPESASSFEKGESTPASTESRKPDRNSALPLDDDTPTQTAVGKPQSLDTQPEPIASPDAKDVKGTAETSGQSPTQVPASSLPLSNPPFRPQTPNVLTGPGTVTTRQPSTAKPVIIWRPKPLHKPGASPHPVHPHKP